MQASNLTRIQFSLQEILTWTAVFALALSLLMIWEFPWLAVLSIGVGGYLVETIGRRRAVEVSRFGDWLGLFAGYLLLGSGLYLFGVEGNSSNTWILPLIVPVAPVYAEIARPFGLAGRSWELSWPEVVLASGVCFAYFAIVASIAYRYPQYRWAIVAIVLGIGVLNFLFAGESLWIPRA
ncbi:MAG: hypothetical protein WD045_03035 [Pirellulaceae bacterium]